MDVKNPAILGPPSLGTSLFLVWFPRILQYILFTVDVCHIHEQSGVKYI